MKPIIINENNKVNIETLLSIAQGNAVKRLLTIQEIFNATGLVNAFKNKFALTWNKLEACKFIYDTYVSQGSKYKYHQRIAYTSMEIVVENSKCRIASIKRQEDFDRLESKHKFHASFLTPKAERAIIENAKYL